MTHQFKVLHENELGYIAICTDCNNIHIELGSFMSIVSQRSFRLITEDFKAKKTLQSYYLTATPSGLKMIIQITDNTYITLTTEEFEQAVELLDMSSHLLNVLEIINQ